MIYEFWKRDLDARAADLAAEGRDRAPFQRRVDWDNPSGDEPSVPIIYEPA